MTMITDNAVYNVDALTLLAGLGDASVDMILTDPPYNGVKDSKWDNQWATDKAYIDWLCQHLKEFRRVLKPDGSLYLFASPKMAARVEVAVSDYFNVLNSIVWNKPYSRHSQADTDVLRGYFPSTERIIFAEHLDSDILTGYLEAEITLKKRLFGEPLREAMETTNTSTHELVEAVKAYRKHNHGGAASNWIAGYNIPTKEQYELIRFYLNGKSNHKYLTCNYDDLRRELDTVKQKHEAVRRPFDLADYAPYTDVWTFRPAQAYPGKHECEKPLALLKHIINTSSRSGALVLDCFCGGGSTLDAAKQLGRRYIGGDIMPEYVKIARQRLALPFTLPLFD